MILIKFKKLINLEIVLFHIRVFSNYTVLVFLMFQVYLKHSLGVGTSRQQLPLTGCTNVLDNLSLTTLPNYMSEVDLKDLSIPGRWRTSRQELPPPTNLSSG